MDLIKRHLWLVITLAAMVILSAVACVVMIMFKGQGGAIEKVLTKSNREVKSISPYYPASATATLIAAKKHRDAEAAAIEKFIVASGKWTPLVPGIFPVYRSNPDVYKFKGRYGNEKMAEFRDTLGGVLWDPSRGATGGLPQNATMYILPGAFYKDDWIDAPGLGDDKAKTIKQLVDRQHDLWLQEDIVMILKRANDTCFDYAKIPAEKRTVATATVKELHKIDIGAQCLPRVAGRGRSQRYLYVGDPPQSSGLGGEGEEEAEEVETRALTLTGRASDNNGKRYYVLPFKVVMIVDAGSYPEVVRQMAGTRSYITVLNQEFEQIPEVDSAYRSADLARSAPEERVFVYGTRPIGKLTLWCESLVFRLPDARPTMPKAKKKSDS